MNDEDKIKQLLRSNEGDNRTLGIVYAKQYLGWSLFNCFEYSLSHFFKNKECGCYVFEYDSFIFKVEINSIANDTAFSVEWRIGEPCKMLLHDIRTEDDLLISLNHIIYYFKNRNIQIDESLDFYGDNTI